MTILLLLILAALSFAAEFFGLSDLAWVGINRTALASTPEMLAIPAFITAIFVPRVGAGVYWVLLVLAVVFSSQSFAMVFWFLGMGICAQCYAVLRSRKARNRAQVAEGGVQL
jgi:hypothetical protein